MRKTAIIINCIIIFILFSQPFFGTLPSVGDGEVSHLASPDPSGVGASVKSEEENIDSFDVNPKSGRWNVTSDNSTDDLVTDSILRMTTTNNLTSDVITSAVGYEMNRGTTKTDGKIEYRMAASGGGNQTEYFRDEIGDKMDFEEGDDEGVTGEVFTVSNGLLVSPNDVGFINIHTQANINTKVYHTLEFKIKGYNTIGDQIKYQPDVGASVTIGVISDEWQVISYEFAIDVEEFDTDVYFFIRDKPTGQYVEFEYIKLIGDLDYATHVEGEIEDTWDWEVDNSTESWTGLLNMNVSEGFLRGTMAPGGADDLLSAVDLNIDTSLFEILSIRLNTSDITMDIRIRADLGAGLVDVTTRKDIDSTSQTVYTFDLSDDSDWAGTCIRLDIRFDEQDDTLDGDEIVFIDYVLLLGHWDDSESVIGLFDQDNLVPLLNVSTVFTSNNSHSSTSDKAYFTVELLDLDGEIAYSAISANYTDISDLWIETKITFDVLRSRLVVTINADNDTRIDKWTFPQDFYIISGRIPALFSHEKNPSIFTSTFCQAISWQEMKLDYIKADYKEREWIQIDTPTDPEIISDSVFGLRAEDDIIDTSIYQMTVPRLDAVSGVFSSNFTNPGNLIDGDSGTIGFTILGVDADDGGLHSVAFVQLGLGNTTPFGNLYDLIVQTGDVQLINTFKEGDFNPKISFSFRIFDDRKKGELSLRFFEDTFDTTDQIFFDVIGNVTIADEVTDPSQEFVIQLFYTIQLEGDSIYTALYESLAWFERDRLAGFPVSDHHSSTSTADNWLAQIFIEVGRFFAAAISAIMSPLFLALGLLVTAVGTVVTAAVNQLQGWLTTLGSTIGTAINQIQGWLNTIATTISEAIAAIANDIWTAFGTAAADIMDDIITALTGLAADFADFMDAMIQFLIPLLLAIAEDLAGLVVGILDSLIAIGGDILAGIINFIAGAVFFFWEALGLPDVLAILDLMLTPIVETITGIPQAILDFIEFFTPLFIVLVALYWFWLIFLAFAQEGFDPFAGLAESFGRLFTTLDFSIMGFGPIPFPIAFFFIPLTYFLILPPESMFAIW